MNYYNCDYFLWAYANWHCTVKRLVAVSLTLNLRHQCTSVLHQKGFLEDLKASEPPSPPHVFNIGSHPLHAAIVPLCGAETFLSLTLFFHFTVYPTISVTFHANNRVQHYEGLPGETVWKYMPLFPYLNNIASSLLSVKAGLSPRLPVWPFRWGMSTFDFWRGQTTLATAFPV